MKKYRSEFLIAAVFFFGIAAAGTALADDGPLTKLGRGFTNIVEGPFELYAQCALLPPTGDPALNLIEGSVRGFAMFLARELVGIYDVVTFPVPIPWGYKPVFKPATTFTDWEHRKPEPAPYKPPSRGK